jgi:antitoxin component YwqK of YwqJK toxin-antitoxin module
MKKIPFYIIILTFYGCQNNNEIIKCNVTVSNNIGYVDGKVYNGTCNIYRNDSLLWRQRTYKKGKPIKEIGYYIPGGEIEYEGNSKDWKIHGDFISYYRNGEISIEGELDMGRYVGEWKYYDDDGSLNKTLNYNKKGEKIDSIMHKQ